MNRCTLYWLGGLAALALLVGPTASLAQTACSAAQPRLAPAFSDLASRLGSRAGSAAECEHTDATSGDVQQSTTTGLLYLRQSTNLPTFTDGGEHWALRSGQLLEWTTSDVDPPASAQTVAVTATAAPITPIATAQPISPPASVAVPDLTGPVVATSLAVILLAIAVTVGLSVLRRGRRQSVWAFRPGTHLATQTAPATALATTISNIGNGRATAEAHVILSRDPDRTAVQVRPVALAVLFSAILKWLLVILVGLLILAAFGQAALTLGLVAIATIYVLLAYAPLSATVYRVTTQRIEITTGVLSRRTITRETYEFRDAIIRQPPHYRLFGVSDLSIEDRNGGWLVLRAISGAEGVRDLIRGSGQFEAARIEKAAWR